MADIKLRDYFASKAMQSLITARATLPLSDYLSFARANADGLAANIADEVNGVRWIEELANEAYEISDAMMQERRQWEAPFEDE